MVLVLLVCACTEAGGNDQPVNSVKIQSVTFDARRQPPVSELVRLRDMGVTHLTLIQFGWQAGHDVPEIRMHTDANWFSEGDRGIRILARQADSLGMGLILKPHLWIRRGQGRDTVGFETEEDWRAWEAQYLAFMMHYAHLAEAVGASMLVVGTELANAARTRPDFWRRLITDVRAVYGGALTYAANWYEEYEHIAFWDALDYIGVQGYFELSREENPTPAMLAAGWVPYKTTLQRLSKQFGRPVFFTEIGYRNVSYAAAQPWRWPSRDEVNTVPEDDALQVRLYEAFFESFWDEPWFAGTVIWKWHPEAEERRRPLDFTPQHKPAEAVIARWFARPHTAQPVASPR